MPGPAEEAHARFASPFVPSRNGFEFPNAWEDHVLKLDVGGKPFVISLLGRCGGMSFAALDYYRIGIDAAALAGREMPDKRSEIARYIMGRQIGSLAGGLAANMARFVAWTLRPTGGPQGAAALSRGREAGSLLAAMVAGNPVPLGLVTADRLGGMGLNHQVVAYATRQDARGLRVYIYDPNFPGATTCGWSSSGRATHRSPSMSPASSASCGAACSWSATAL